MVEEKMYGYTFPLDSGGIWIDSPFKIHIGQIFEYWGYTWKVEGEYSEQEQDENVEVTEFYCERYDD